MYKEYRKEYCWTISNIVAGNSKDHVLIIINEFLPLIKITIHEMNIETKKEVVWILYNIIYKNEAEYIKPILEFLDFIFYMIKKDFSSERSFRSERSERSKCLKILLYISTIDKNDYGILDLAEDLLVEENDDGVCKILDAIIDQYA